MMNDGSCLIMMASYNGERFIRDQIESVIGQTYTDWELVIQDDGWNMEHRWTASARQ